MKINKIYIIISILLIIGYFLASSHLNPNKEPELYNYYIGNIQSITARDTTIQIGIYDGEKWVKDSLGSLPNKFWITTLNYKWQEIIECEDYIEDESTLVGCKRDENSYAFPAGSKIYPQYDILASESHYKAKIGQELTFKTLETQNLNDNSTLEGKIWSILDENDLSLTEKIKAVSIIECESGWYQYAVGKTEDYGLWQISEKFHKKRVEEKYGKDFREVAFDLELSTDYALTLFFENNRSWKLWTCN